MKNFVTAGALGCALLAAIAYGPAQAMRGGHMGGGHMGMGGGHMGGWHMGVGGHPSMAFHSHPAVFSHARPFFAHHAHPFFFRHHAFFRHHHFRNFAFIGFPYYDNYYNYGYGCGWLYRQAIYTGSQYWWSR